MGFGGRGVGVKRALANNGVCKEAEGKNRELCSREANIQTLNRLREDGGLQCVTKVVGEITHPQTGEEGGRVKENMVSSIK